MKRVIRKLLCGVKIAGWYAFLGLTGFALIIFVVIELLATKVVCTVCGIEPRMLLSFKLGLRYVRYIGKLGGKYADKPDEDFDGRSYNEWVDDAEKWLKDQFTRL